MVCGDDCTFVARVWYVVMKWFYGAFVFCGDYSGLMVLMCNVMMMVGLLCVWGVW